MPPVDGRASGDHAVAEKLFLVQSERVGAMDDERIELGERALVDQRIDSLAGRAFAALMLFLDRFRAGRRLHLLAFLGELAVSFLVRPHLGRIIL